MILDALEFLRATMDSFIKKEFAFKESKVILNSLIEPNGAIPQANHNKLVFTLVNFRKEAIFNSPAGSPKPETYTVSLLVTSSFDDYAETLKFLGTAIQFLEQNPLYQRSAYPKFPPDLQDIKLTMENTSFQELQLLWTGMGAKYQPSAVYQLTLIK
jgi:Pvc16 N-terminal domain